MGLWFQSQLLKLKVIVTYSYKSPSKKIMSIRNASPHSLAAMLINSPSEIPARIASIVASYEAPPLYSRHWMNFAAPDTSKDTNTCTSDSSGFRVMQFNILAEGLSAHPDNTPPFVEDCYGSPISASTCGGFDYNPSSALGELVFNFHDYRKWRLLEEILRVNPDVLALEEIDHYLDFFEPLLTSIGYKGIFQPKKVSPSTQFGYYSDGVAVFWKDAVFSDDGLEPHCSNEVSPCIVVPLKHRFTDKSIVFAATHLKSKPSEANEARRESQIKALLSMAQESLAASGGDSCGFMLLGDFNTDAYSSPQLQAKVIPYVLGWNDGCLHHTYPLPTDESSDYYSTWKSRSGRQTKHFIDYMFYSHESLGLRGVLGPPASDEIEESEFKLPDLRYPSDHISIAADMTILH